MVFVIITAWYLTDKNFKIYRIANTWMTLLLYSISAGLYFFVREGNSEYLLKQCFPIMTFVVWYVSVYLLLLCTQPVLNLVLHKCSRIQLKYLLMVLLFTESIAVTFYPASNMRLGYYALFCTIYLCTGYIKKYMDLNHMKRIYLAGAFVFGYAVPPFVYFLFLKYDKVIPSAIYGLGFSGNIYFGNISSIPCLMAAFSLFLLIQSLHIQINSKKIKKIITLIGKVSLDIYILLAMTGPGNTLWWAEAFGIPRLTGDKRMLFKIYGYCAAAYAAAAIAGVVRMRIFSFLFNRPGIKRRFSNFDSRING